MQILKTFSEVLDYIRFQCFSTIIFICATFYIDDLNVAVGYSNNILYRWNHHYRQLVSTMTQYQIQGSVIYTVNSHKKTYIKFLWIKYDNDHYHIKLFNIVGFTIISICIKQNVIYIIPNFISQNNEIIDKIQRWFIQTNFFEKQLQKWIIGLPGDNTKFNLNDSGYLSDINYHIHDENILVFYRHYYMNHKPVLPEILDIYYNQYFIKLHIDCWIQS